jgi:hypothetical protein
MYHSDTERGLVLRSPVTETGELGEPAELWRLAPG